jgi:hypothetical protein
MAARSDKDKKSEPNKKVPETASIKVSSKKKIQEDDDFYEDDEDVKPKKSETAS